MAKTRQSKELTVTDLVKKLGTMKALVFSQYSGLTVKEATELRNTLRQQEIDLLIAKKTLLRRALKEVNLDPALVDQLEGGVAMAFGYQDEVLPAKILQTFAKTHPAVKLIGGVVNGQFMTGPQVVALSKLPGREELLAQLVWTVKGPLTGLVNVLSGNMRSLIYVLQAISGEAGSGSAGKINQPAAV